MSATFGVVSFTQHDPSILRYFSLVEYSKQRMSSLAFNGLKDLRVIRYPELNQPASERYLDCLRSRVCIGCTSETPLFQNTLSEARLTRHKDVMVAVHGDVANLGELHRSLRKEGHLPASGTFITAIPALINRFLTQGFDPSQALNRALEQMTGAFSLCLMFKHSPNQLFAAHRGVAVVIGVDQNAYAVTTAPDAIQKDYPLRITLRYGQQVCLSQDPIQLRDICGRRVTPRTDPIHTCK